jgi:hypothetical protein
MAAPGPRPPASGLRSTRAPPPSKRRHRIPSPRRYAERIEPLLNERDELIERLRRHEPEPEDAQVVELLGSPEEAA